MSRRFHVRTAPACALAALLAGAAMIPVSGAQDAPIPLTINTGRVTIAGSSNVHEWSASTTAVRVTRATIAGPLAGEDAWAGIARPGGLEAFEIEIAAASLASEKEGLDKNMHKALQVKEHPAITFRLLRLEEDAGALKAVGMLQIAGVEREVAFAVKTQRTGAMLTVTGSVPLLMTDFGIKPPKAMLGMLKTDPQVTVTFETVLALPLT